MTSHTGCQRCYISGNGGAMKWLKEVPKTELHVHLEGATTPETYLELAEKNGVSLPFTTPEDGYRYFHFVNLVHFLEVYHTCTTAIRKPEDFRMLIDRFAKSRMEENIRYCEFYISLSLHIMHELDPVDVLSEIGIACRQAEVKYDIKLRCIPDVSRDRDIGIALDALKAVIRGKSEYIIGLGLGGSERNDSKKFAGIFSTANQAGLKLVAHAGEWRDSQVIWDAVNHLGAQRIGHGFTATKDPQLMDFLVATQIPIEVCPSSNIRVGLVPEGGTHPIKEMIRRGLNITVHSDDPTMFGTTLTKELEDLTQGVDPLSEQEMIALLKRNINASFMPVAEKKMYFDQLNGFLIKNGIDKK